MPRAKLCDFASVHNSGSPEQSNMMGRHSAPILFCGRGGGGGGGGGGKTASRKKCDLLNTSNLITGTS